MNVSINGVRKSYWPKLGCAMNKGIDSAAKGSDENAVRESLSELGYTGTFGERGNVRQEICIAEPKEVAPRWRKLFRCGLVALQLGGSNCGAALSCSKLEEGFSARTCRPPSRSSEFRVRLAGLHAEQSALQNRNADSRRTMTLSRPQKVCRAALGEGGRGGCGYSCDFFHSRWYGFTPDDTWKSSAQKRICLR